MQEQGGFRRRVVGGAASTMVAQVVRIGATFGSTIIVARILSPGDYGVYAMAAPVTGFALMFQNVGFDHAVVQSREISETQLSSLFWLNVALCAALAALLAAVSPLVTMFYGNPAGGRLVAASGLLVLATAPNPLLSAMLNRAMRFHAQSMAEIVSAIVMLGTTVVAAVILRSYWALLIGAVASTIANTLSFSLMLRWRPRLQFDWSSIAPLVTFGGGVSSYGFSQYLTRNLDNILLARFWGVAPLGYYDRAYKLTLSPLQNFTSPMARNLLPVLARTRDDPARFRRAYLTFVQAIALCAIPGVVAAAVGAEEVVDILLGGRWRATAPIFRWLAATAALLLVNEMSVWLFVSTGRVRAMVRWSFVAATSMIVGFVAGLPWGPLGLAVAYLVGETLRTPFLFAAATRRTPVRFGDLARLHLVSVASVAGCVLVIELAGSIVASLPRIMLLATCSYAAAAIALPFTELGAQMYIRLTGRPIPFASSR